MGNYIQKQILGVITARGGSKGLARKNIQLLGGKPLINYTIEAAQKSKYLTHTVVSTEDTEIAKIANSCGGWVPFRRPVELAQDNTPIFPVLRHATLKIESLKNIKMDCILLLQPTSPFRTGEDIDACIERFFDLEAEVVMTAKTSEASPSYNLIEGTPGTPWTKLCSQPRIILNRRQEAPATWTVHGAVYVYARDALFNYEHHLRMERAAIYEMPEEKILDIDSKMDLLWAEFLLKHNN